MMEFPNIIPPSTLNQSLPYYQPHIQHGISTTAGEFMSLLAAIKREEKNLEKQLRELPGQLNGVCAASKALGHAAGREATTVKKRVMSLRRERSLARPPRSLDEVSRGSEKTHKIVWSLAANVASHC